MKVDVKIIGVLKRADGKNDFQLELPQNSTVRGLLENLGYSDNHKRLIFVSVNGTLQKNNTLLCDNDKVELSMAVGGG